MQEAKRNSLRCIGTEQQVRFWLPRSTPFWADNEIRWNWPNCGQISKCDQQIEKSIGGFEPRVDLRSGLERTIAWLTMRPVKAAVAQ